MLGAVLLAIAKFMFGPYAAPIWATISGLVVLFVQSRENKKKQDFQESATLRKEDREDFRVLREAMHEELDRLKLSQAETNKKLELSHEETRKCEDRYFELAVQYRELLNYCASLASEVRQLKTKLATLVAREKKNNDNNNKRVPSGTDKDLTGSAPGEGSNEETI